MNHYYYYYSYYYYYISNTNSGWTYDTTYNDYESYRNFYSPNTDNYYSYYGVYDYDYDYYYAVYHVYDPSNEDEHYYSYYYTGAYDYTYGEYYWNSDTHNYNRAYSDCSGAHNWCHPDDTHRGNFDTDDWHNGLAHEAGRSSDKWTGDINDFLHDEENDRDHRDPIHSSGQNATVFWDWIGDKMTKTHE